MNVKMAGIMPRIIMTNALLALTLALCGCNPGTSLVEDKSKPTEDKKPPVTQPASEKPDDKAVASNKPDDKVTASNSQDPATQSKPAEGQVRFIPERTFQIKNLQKVKLKVGEHEFNSWIMDTDAKRQEGMMFMEDSDFNEKDTMTFVFYNEDERRFWMHNTHVDLDICYCDRTGKIVKTYTMAKMDETTDYSSKGGSMYVIEFKAGVLKKLGIKAGMKFEIPKDVVSKDNGNG